MFGLRLVRNCKAFFYFLNFTYFSTMKRLLVAFLVILSMAFTNTSIAFTDVAETKVSYHCVSIIEHVEIQEVKTIFMIDEVSSISECEKIVIKDKNAHAVVVRGSPLFNVGCALKHQNKLNSKHIQLNKYRRARDGLTLLS